MSMGVVFEGVVSDGRGFKCVCNFGTSLSA